jgi:thiamine-phosphate diphosphorylase
MCLLGLTDPEKSRNAGRTLAETVAAAVAGGATAIVYREKTLPGPQRRALGQRVAEACGSATLIVASDPVLARDLGATTVHLAADDPWPEGDDLIVGRSCHGAVELAGAAAHGAAYATLSPIFVTDSKPGYGPALGLDGLATLVADARLPVYALGGIRAATVPGCLAAGAAGVAVMGTVMGADAPDAAVRALLDQEVQP